MKVMIALTVVLAVGTQAHAASTEDVPRERVSIADLRQDTPEGLATLYKRLHAAAERVCAPSASIDRLNFNGLRCVAAAMERATAQIPALAKYDVKKRKATNG